jgi:Ser-tRNA(Ala) deacylase AlaX
MTKLIYLENQNLYQASSKVLEIVHLEQGKAVILDQTIFYVQGGGQPGDKGQISSNDGIFEVSKTIFNEQGQALHIGIFTKGDFEAGDIVELTVDQPSRKLNSRIHSAGHLIDLAVKKCGLNWKSGKSYHYPEGSYIEYSGNTDLELNSKTSMLIEQINQEYNLLVKQNLRFQIKLDYDQSYKGQPLRIVSVGGQIECPCSGTHVDQTSELEGFQITKIKLKSGAIKLSYGLQL